MYGFVCGKTISFLFSWFLKYTVNVASIEKKKKMTGSFMDQKFREVIKVTIYGKCRQTKLIRLIFYPITLSGGF